jgi:hypothetical protein
MEIGILECKARVLNAEQPRLIERNGRIFNNCFENLGQKLLLFHDQSSLKEKSSHQVINN